MTSSGPRPLFVAGCQRSGTTAFAEYLNKHPKILVGVERYKGIPARRITSELFTFERLLNYKEETIRPKEYYAGLLSKKIREELEWVGDKNPNYLLHFDILSENNPGAHFIVLYRPVEEVAESWEVGSKNSEDPWRGRENGLERGVEIWNRALRKTREFIEGGTQPRVLIVPYHDFFYRNEACVSLISRFLALEFDESIRREWRETSARFERERRSKRPLTEEETWFVRQHKDRAAEEWILDRIGDQWKALERGAEKTEDVARSSGGSTYGATWAATEDEAGRTRRLEQRVRELEDYLARGDRTVERLRERNIQLTGQLRDVRRQLRTLQNSRSWRFLNRLARLRARLLVWRR